MSNWCFGSVLGVFGSNSGFLLIEVFVSLMIITMMTLLMHQLLMLYCQ